MTLAKRLILVGIIAVVASAAALAWVRWAPRRVPPGQPPLATLGVDSLPEFRRTFNASNAHVRVVALLSPT